MGNCSSGDAASVATAKLVLQDGRLQEYPYPVKVSYVLQKDPTCFICNSDDMEFDGVVSAVSADEELQPGQLYFALPLSRLRHPIQPEEMAALAVKASAALMKSGVASADQKLAPASCRKILSPEELPGRNGRRNRASGRRSHSSAMLTAIPE